MSIPNKVSAYGEIPERFDRCLADALRMEEKPVKKKRRAVVLIAALLIVLLAATAIAVAGKIGLLDILSQFNKGARFASDMVATDIRQTGGDTENVRFTVREAIYDGYAVHVLIEAAPKEEGAAVMMKHWLQSGQMIEEASAFGDTLIGTDVQAPLYGGQPVLPHLLYMGFRDEARLAYVSTSVLPEGMSPDALSIEAECSVYGSDGKVAEQTLLRFEVPKTVEPETQTFDTQIETELADFVGATITQTPLETVISVTMRAKLMAFQEVSYVPRDGLVNIRRWSNWYNQDVKTGLRSFYFQFQSADLLQDVIPIWITGTDLALVLDRGTGAVTLRRAEVTFVDDEGYDIPKVTITDEEVSP